MLGQNPSFDQGQTVFEIYCFRWALAIRHLQGVLTDLEANFLRSQAKIPKKRDKKPTSRAVFNSDRVSEATKCVLDCDFSGVAPDIALAPLRTGDFSSRIVKIDRSTPCTRGTLSDLVCSGGKNDEMSPVASALQMFVSNCGSLEVYTNFNSRRRESNTLKLLCMADSLESLEKLCQYSDDLEMFLLFEEMMHVVPAIGRALAHNPALVQHYADLDASQKVLNDLVAQRMQPPNVLEPFGISFKITLSLLVVRDKRLLWFRRFRFFEKFNILTPYVLYQCLRIVFEF